MNVPAIELTASGRRARKPSNPTRVKKFLPQLLAFLLCFAGGMSLCPVPVARGKSRAVTTVLDLPGAAASHAKWLAKQNELAGNLTQMKAAKQKQAQGEENQKQADLLLEAIATARSKFEANKEQVRWCEDAKKLLSPLEDASAAVKAKAAGIKPGEGGAYDARLKLLGEYTQVRNQYDITLQSHARKLNEWLRANPVPIK